MQWAPSPSGCFSTTSAWKALRRARPVVPWHKLVWFSGFIPKASFILWLAVKQRLGTQDRLFAPLNTGCLLCWHHLENHDHLFFECSITKQIWTTMLSKCGCQFQSLKWMDYIQWMATHWQGNSLPTRIRKLTLAATVYTIWMERNDRFHTNSFRNVGSIVGTISNLIRSKLLSLEGIEDNGPNRIVQHQWSLPDSIFSLATH